MRTPYRAASRPASFAPRLLLALSLFNLLPSHAAAARTPQSQGNAPRAVTTTGGGLHTTTFDTLHGRVLVHLPDDMRAGDTISGTVILEPKGQTEEEREANGAKLSEIKLDLGSKFPKNKKQLLIFVMPKLVTPFTAEVPESFDYTIGINAPRADGQTVTVPINSTVWFVKDQPTAQRTEPPAADDFRLPSMGQQGRPIQIFGPFDGEASNTTLQFIPTGSAIEKSAENVSDSSGSGRLLAESPRYAVFESPTNFTGPSEIIIRERIVEMRGTYRNLGVRLSAPKTSLMRGEQTIVTIEVSGLGGIQRNVPLQLDSKGVIEMSGGNFQNLQIRPPEVRQDGRYTTTRNITGTQAGGFSVTATVVVRPFDFCLQDDTSGRRLLLNSFSGDYMLPIDPAPSTGVFVGGSRRFDGRGMTGTGKVSMKGCLITLTHNTKDRRVLANIDACRKTGSAEVQSKPGEKFQITDGNTADNVYPSHPTAGLTSPDESVMLSPKPQPDGQPATTPAGTEVPRITIGGVNAAAIAGQVVHVEGTPGGGRGLWLVKIKLQSGQTTNVFIKSDKRPDLKFCNWIKIGGAHDEGGDTYVDSYELTEDPTKKPPPTPTPTPDTKPPKTETGDPTTTTTGPPPCKDGEVRNISSETETFEYIEDDAHVSFGMSSTSDAGISAALGMADFWKTAASVVKEITDRLPASGGGAVAVGLVVDYLDKGGDILNAVAKSRIARLNEGVQMQLAVTTYKVTVTCYTFEVCENGKWVTKKRLENPQPSRSIYSASRRAHLGDAERDKIEDSSRPQFLDPAKVDQWAKDFLKSELDKLRKAKQKYDEFVKNCK